MEKVDCLCNGDFNVNILLPSLYELTKVLKQWSLIYTVAWTKFCGFKDSLEFSWWSDSKTVLDFENERRVDWDIQGQQHGIT